MELSKAKMVLKQEMDLAILKAFWEQGHEPLAFLKYGSEELYIGIQWGNEQETGFVVILPDHPFSFFSKDLGECEQVLFKAAEDYELNIEAQLISALETLVDSQRGLNLKQWQAATEQAHRVLKRAKGEVEPDGTPETIEELTREWNLFLKSNVPVHGSVIADDYTASEIIPFIDNAMEHGLKAEHLSYVIDFKRRWELAAERKG